VSICCAPDGAGSAIVSVALIGHVRYRRDDVHGWMTDQYAHRDRSSRAISPQNQGRPVTSKWALVRELTN